LIRRSPPHRKEEDDADRAEDNNPSADAQPDGQSIPAGAFPFSPEALARTACLPSPVVVFFIAVDDAHRLSARRTANATAEEFVRDGEVVEARVATEFDPHGEPRSWELRQRN
jgi:hypothetical protein